MARRDRVGRRAVRSRLLDRVEDFAEPGDRAGQPVFAGEFQSFGGEGFGLIELERAQGRVRGEDQRLGLLPVIAGAREESRGAAAHPARILRFEGLERGAGVDEAGLGLDRLIAQPVFALDHGEYGLGEAARVFVGAARECVTGRGQAMDRRAIEQPRDGKMPEQNGRHTIEPFGVAGLQEFRVRAVQRAPTNLIDGPIGRIEEEGAGEGETGAAGYRVLAEHASLHEAFDHRLGRGAKSGEMAQFGRIEGSADDRGRLQNAAVGVGHGRDLFLHELLKGVRQGQALGTSAPRRQRELLEPPLGREAPHEFGHEEGIAAGGLEKGEPGVLGNPVLAEDAHRELPAVGGLERFQLNDQRALIAADALEELRHRIALAAAALDVGSGDHQARRGPAVEDVLNGLERGVGEMKVLEEEDERLRRGEPAGGAREEIEGEGPILAPRGVEGTAIRRAPPPRFRGRGCAARAGGRRGSWWRARDRSRDTRGRPRRNPGTEVPDPCVRRSGHEGRWRLGSSPRARVRAGAIPCRNPVRRPRVPTGPRRPGRGGRTSPVPRSRGSVRRSPSPRAGRRWSSRAGSAGS